MDYNTIKTGDYVYKRVRFPKSTALYKVRLVRKIGDEWVARYAWGHSTRVNKDNMSHRTATIHSPDFIEEWVED